MKNFEQICKMTQFELKKHMHEFLTNNDYVVANEDGFLYANPKKDRIPILLVAHMDTVHREICEDIINENGKLSSPQGIGGDDRCGVYMIMNIVKELHCPVLLTEDEEVGCIGAHKFTASKYTKELNINYMIEFDRKGSNDAVYYSCDNKTFKAFIEENTDLKEAQGSYSDISAIMPAIKIAGVNISCGYYNAHTTAEYVKFDEMLHIIEIAKKLIKVDPETHFEYVAKTYSNFNYRDYHQTSLFNDRYSSNSKYVAKRGKVIVDDVELELEVVWNDFDGREDVCTCYGKTKAECWFNFFMENPEVCFDMVSDYSWN